MGATVLSRGRFPTAPFDLRSPGICQRLFDPIMQISPGIGFGKKCSCRWRSAALTGRPVVINVFTPGRLPEIHSASSWPFISPGRLISVKTRSIANFAARLQRLGRIRRLVNAVSALAQELGHVHPNQRFILNKKDSLREERESESRYPTLFRPPLRRLNVA